MHWRILTRPLALLICISVVPAQAATVTLWTEFFEDDPLVGFPRRGLQLFLSSDADIVSISHVGVVLPTGELLFQVPPPFGSNVEPPDPLFAAINRSLMTDSWLSTPGVTTLAGTDLPGNGAGVWSDPTDDGPQSDFQWGMLTPQSFGTGFIFTGRINLAGAAGPVSQGFRIDGLTGDVALVPEPSSVVLAGLGLAGTSFLLRRRRSPD